MTTVLVIFKNDRAYLGRILGVLQFEIWRVAKNKKIVDVYLMHVKNTGCTKTTPSKNSTIQNSTIQKFQISRRWWYALK